MATGHVSTWCRYPVHIRIWINLVYNYCYWSSSRLVQNSENRQNLHHGTLARALRSWACFTRFISEGTWRYEGNMALWCCHPLSWRHCCFTRFIHRGNHMSDVWWCPYTTCYECVGARIHMSGVCWCQNTTCHACVGAPGTTCQAFVGARITHASQPLVGARIPHVTRVLIPRAPHVRRLLVPECHMLRVCWCPGYHMLPGYHMSGVCWFPDTTYQACIGAPDTTGNACAD